MAGISKEEKKTLMKQWKAEQNDDYALSEENVRELFEYLEVQLGNSNCDHTLQHTKQWLKDHVPTETLDSAIAEITDMGGYCDCEVLLNCYETYDIG